MGQAAIKATRRDIRRAVGAEALTTISEQEQATRWLVQQVQTLRADVYSELADVAKSRMATTSQFLQLLPATDTFLGRLRWLFLGR